MRRFLIRLYPADWRARYGDEFEAILEERALGPFDVADVLLAAIDAHIRPRGSAAAGDHTRGVLMTLRIGGVAAIIGGVLWLVSLFGASVIQGPDGQPWQALFVFALGALLVAMIGLSGDQGREQPGLVWAAVAIPIVGAAISAVGMLGMTIVGDQPFLFGASPWEVWVLGTIAMIIGSGLFALASLRVGGVSRIGAALLVIGAIAAVPVLFGIASPDGAGAIGNVIALLGIGAFAAGWVWLGIGAVRTDRSAGLGRREAIP
jgi:OFA family oxalate/formate antiporter-like MFS transporter